jgi:hypothetical protein
MRNPLSPIKAAEEFTGQSRNRIFVFKPYSELTTV